MDKSKGCPKCGCEIFYSNFTGKQYYKADGDPDGFHLEGRETKTIRCLNCRYKTTLERLMKKNETASNGKGK